MSCSHQGTERFPKGCQGQITKVMGILLPVHEGIKGAEGGRPRAEGKHWQSRTRDGDNVLPAFPGKKGLWIDRDGWLLPATDLRCSEGKEIHAVWMRARTAWEGSCGAELRASSTGSEGSRRGMPGRDLGAAVGRARGSAAAGEAGKGSGIPWNDPGLEPGLDAKEQGCIGIPRGNRLHCESSPRYGPEDPPGRSTPRSCPGNGCALSNSRSFPHRSHGSALSQTEEESTILGQLPH